VALPFSDCDGYSYRKKKVGVDRQCLAGLFSDEHEVGRTQMVVLEGHEKALANLDLPSFQSGFLVSRGKGGFDRGKRASNRI
jgi:hypothetical protein